MSSHHHKAADDSLAEHLRAFGCPGLIRLDRPLSEPGQLEYLDLLPKRKSSPALPLAGVAEHQGTALLYVVDATSDESIDGHKLSGLQRLLANRSTPAWLGIARPGSLEIHPIGFHAEPTTAALDVISVEEARAPLFFQQLVHGTYEKKNLLPAADYVFTKIFELLSSTHAAFVPRTELDPIHVLSMAGRALFWRFLIDRGIVLPNECADIAPAADDLKDCFSSAEKAAQTSAWLDETFNGDFLQLIDESIPSEDRPARQAAYLRYYSRTGKVAPEIFTHLHAILRGWRAVPGGHQAEFDWGDLDFAHIPVGVLSQVYENFSHRLDAASAQKKSVHYTPRLIAQLMVDQVFAAAPKPAEARVLDPACGASIFLVLAFRRLVRECWQRDNKRPDAETIRSILYNQLCGFDVSEAALRLSALSLYITAIEVNGTPRPPNSLRFPKNLRRTVLHSFADPDAAGTKDAFEIGSLGPAVPADFDGAFDIVIGNPPWTRLRDDEDDDVEETDDTDALNDAFTAIGRRALSRRGLAEFAASYENPDKNPDLPFLWRATEWAKPNGLIALALPARIFGRTSGKGFDAWRAVLHGVSVTGIVNGADLRKTPVWDGMDIPWCAFFARNTKSASDHRFYFTTPLKEPGLNVQSRFRIDYEKTQPIGVERIERQPWLLKTLSLGTWRDVEVLEGILGTFPVTLSAMWDKWDPSGNSTGKGYDLSPKLKPKPAEFLAKLPNFIPPVDTFCLDGAKPITFFATHKRTTAYRPKTEALYQPPLVIVPQSPGADSTKPRAYRSDQPLAFSQSYYGYSCAGHPEAETLASLLYLIPHTTLFAYFCLMTSRRTGFDRQTFNKEELDAIPFPNVATFDARTKKKLRDLAHRLQHDAKKPWDEIDETLFALYGLDADAVQVARDTLFSAASYRRQGRAALGRTTRDSRAAFRDTLRTELEPFFDVCGEHAAVTEPAFQPDSWTQPWVFVAVAREGEATKVSPALLRKAMQVANERSASRIVVKLPGRAGLLLGLLNEQRWWTVTRAQLCAQHLVRHHLAVFDLTDAA